MFNVPPSVQRTQDLDDKKDDTNDYNYDETKIGKVTWRKSVDSKGKHDHSRNDTTTSNKLTQQSTFMHSINSNANVYYKYVLKSEQTLKKIETLKKLAYKTQLEYTLP